VARHRSSTAKPTSCLDADGNHLDGGKTYKLNIPKDAPALKFWSVCLYDPQTRSMLQTDQTFPSKQSQRDKLIANDDGSIDLYFGPKAPAGKEANWTQFDAIARLENASKSDEFKRSLAAAAAKPLYMVGGTLQDPVGTVKKLGSGAARFLNRAGEAIERGGRKSANTEGAVKSVLGFAKVKREEIAFSGKVLQGSSGQT